MHTGSLYVLYSMKQVNFFVFSVLTNLKMELNGQGFNISVDCLSLSYQCLPGQ